MQTNLSFADGTRPGAQDIPFDHVLRFSGSQSEPLERKHLETSIEAFGRSAFLKRHCLEDVFGATVRQWVIIRAANCEGWRLRKWFMNLAARIPIEPEHEGKDIKDRPRICRDLLN
jgi:hypothetical protein